MPERYTPKQFLPFRPEVILGVLTLFVVSLIYLTLFTRQQALEELHQQASSELDRYRVSVEQRLDRFRSLPELLADHELLADAVTGAEEERVGQANLYLQRAVDLVNALDIYVMDSAGYTRASSNWFKETSFIGRNFSFRPYFTDAMKGQSGRYFALGSTTNKRGYYFSHPMHRNGEIIGVVVVKIDLDQIEERWNNPATEVMVSDEDGVIVISTEPDWMFKTLSPLSDEQMKRIAESLRYGDQPLNSLNIAKRSVEDEQFEIITVLHNESDNPAASAELDTRQYLLLADQISNTGLTVRHLANLQTVEDRVLVVQLITTILGVLIVLASLVAFQRRRIRIERQRYTERESRVRKEQEARIEGVINNTQVGLSLIDTEGKIEYFNPVLERLLGYRLDQIIGKPFHELLSPQDQLLLKRYIELEVATREQHLKLEVDCLNANGSVIPVELTLSNMEQSGRYHLIVTLVDITERREHLQALQRAQNELERRVAERTQDLQAANKKLLSEIENHQLTQNELVQAAKLATIGQMSAGINHELNQPLTAIRNYADNALKFQTLNNAERVTSNLQQIANLTQRMANILHPLKEFSRKQDPQQSSVSLRDLRDGAMSILYGQLERQNVEITWPDNSDQIWLKADLLRMEQVMVNLINNAAQAMEQSEDKQIQIRTEFLGEQIAISVCDTGPGLSDEALEQIFTPFFTTKEQGLGLGLGLSISQRIVESLGGMLSAHNLPEGGAEFRILLNRAQPPSAQATKESE
ncbi:MULTISPECIES: ATP-binding protein [unclassified Marinobacterium]|uniref:sensor histidine kinase n=1 Tax=unclassified Marinobacterium TaxID=2644139 RepID=UPI001569FE8C|nr:MULTISPECIES: ATP-binding protein [unclassified Marinobacterium]NRP58005.1 C4-dicarboxylate transport sensor protein DctB [Marinobacterium sp. xm-d-510]NRP98236.1 C4-dicarboxylate transport sensor protein DctB [Marinobacterium sp. xm-a-127]